jgi:hypothetical protein
MLSKRLLEVVVILIGQKDAVRSQRLDPPGGPCGSVTTKPRRLFPFRPASRSLGWGRSLKLAREVLEISQDQAALTDAMRATVESMRERQAAGGWKPLGNHNYLRRVVETVQHRGTTPALPARTPSKSKTTEALMRLQGHGDA